MGKPHSKGGKEKVVTKPPMLSKENGIKDKQSLNQVFPDCDDDFFMISDDTNTAVSNEHSQPTTDGAPKKESQPATTGTSKKESRPTTNATSSKSILTELCWSFGGNEVSVSGSFNNWDVKLPLTSCDGIFKTSISLPSGKHEYKYFVDGNWIHDKNKETIKDHYGGLNNIIDV